MTAQDETAETLARLQVILADLDGYITRRAEEVAEPLIRQARAEAALQARAAEFETQRQIDLVRELRRRLTSADRRLEREQDARGRLAALLAGDPEERITGFGLPSLDVLVAEVETALAGKSAL